MCATFFNYAKDRKRNNLSIAKPKYDSVGEAHRIIFGFYLICDPKQLRRTYTSISLRLMTGRGTGGRFSGTLGRGG